MVNVPTLSQASLHLNQNVARALCFRSQFEFLIIQSSASDFVKNVGREKFLRPDWIVHLIRMPLGSSNTYRADQKIQRVRCGKSNPTFLESSMGRQIDRMVSSVSSGRSKTSDSLSGRLLLHTVLDSECCIHRPTIHSASLLPMLYRRRRIALIWVMLVLFCSSLHKQINNYKLVCLKCHIQWGYPWLEIGESSTTP